MEIVIDLAMLSYLGLLLAILLVIPGFFLHGLRILKQDWRPILARGVIGIAVWLALSSLMLHVNFLFVFGAAHTPPESRGAVVPMLTCSRSQSGTVWLGGVYVIG
jgi:hypothetical protein